MSTVFVHVGQCGNQIGQAFWKKSLKDDKILESHSFVHADGKLRSVHVDSEPKVLTKISRKLPIREGNLIAGKRGRGTNWALGYHGMAHRGDDHVLDTTLEKLRKEVERCDSYCGCVIMHSLSGGTGSGLGSKLIELIREEYPISHLTSCTFAPCVSGESPLQHYNEILTLSWLQKYCDSVILTHNDDILWRLQKLSESVSFDNMNNTIASSLCGLFLPTDTLTPKSGHNIGMEPWEMIRSVCPVPTTKFITLFHLAKSKLAWDGLMNQTLRRVKRHDSSGKPFKSMANLIVARGDTTNTFLYNMKNMEDKVKSVLGCVPWNPFPLDVWTARNNPVNGREIASLTVASNHSSVVEYLEMLHQRSKVKFDVGAFLHWYWKHGSCKGDLSLLQERWFYQVEFCRKHGSTKMTKEEFDEAFEIISNVIDDYKQAVS